MNLETAKGLPLRSVIDKFGKVVVKSIPNGNAVNYVCAYLKMTGEDHTEADALRWLTNMIGQPSLPANKMSNPSAAAEWKLIRIEELEDLALIRYAGRRGIPADVADQHFVEAYVQELVSGKRMFTLAFANEEGGYALSNVFMNGLAGPKGVTFKRGTEPKPRGMHLFADSFDYLSALIRFPQYVSHHDSIILNGDTEVFAAFAYMIGYGYQMLYSWMPNNAEGKLATSALHRFSKTQIGLGFKQMNVLYPDHRDVNAWHLATKGIVADK